MSWSRIVLQGFPGEKRCPRCLGSNILLQLRKWTSFLFPWEISQPVQYLGLFCSKECGAKQDAETWGKTEGTTQL